MQIEGTAFRVEYGTAHSIDSTAWTAAPEVPFVFEQDQTIVMGTAQPTNLDGTISATCLCGTSFNRWVRNRHYLVPIVEDNVIVAIGVVITSDDTELPPWSEVP